MATDTFAGTGYLGAHTEGGHSWTQVLGTEPASGLQINGDRLMAVGEGEEARYLWSFTPSTDDYDVEVAVDFASNAGSMLIGFVVCMSDDGEDGVQIAFNGFSDELTVTSIATDTELYAVAWTEADQTLAVEVRGDDLELAVNGSPPAAWTTLDISGYADKRIGVYKYAGPSDPSLFFLLDSIEAVDAGGGSVPVNTSAPEVTGTPTEGETLTCDPGEWTNLPTGYTYQWQRRRIVP